MPRQSQQASAAYPQKTFVLDNGGYTIKAGYASPDPEASNDCRIIPNCIARTRKGKIYVADEHVHVAPEDTAEIAFRRPVEKGFIVSWDGEFDIWKQAFFRKNATLPVTPSETQLILTEAPNCLPTLQTNTDQMIFEELGFASAYRCLGPTLVAQNNIDILTGEAEPHLYPAQCILVVDTGYSHTTVTPVLYGRPLHSATRRLDIGGKFLTNYLKELVSNRYLDLRDDPNVVSQMKEDACFVSQDFNTDLDRVWKGTKRDLPPSNQESIVEDYVLPNYITALRGFLRPHDFSRKAAAARLNPAKIQKDEDFCPPGAERFAVPELLFNPADIGMTQAGLAEVIIQSLECLPAGLWPVLLANIVVVGGNANFPGFIERLEAELRALTPTECVLRVVKPEDPITFTWRGGCCLASHPDILKGVSVTRQEYYEHGEAWTAQRFTSGPRHDRSAI